MNTIFGYKWISKGTSYFSFRGALHFTFNMMDIAYRRCLAKLGNSTIFDIFKIHDGHHIFAINCPALIQFQTDPQFYNLI